MTNFAGLNLNSPIIIGSSGLTNTPEKNTALEKAGAGALILPSIFEEQIEIQMGKEIWTDCPNARNFILNSSNEMQLDEYLKLISDSKELCHIPIIASINCYRENGWTDFVPKIETAGADAIELNIYGLDTEIDQLENSVEDIEALLGKPDYGYPSGTYSYHAGMFQIFVEFREGNVYQIYYYN